MPEANIELEPLVSVILPTHNRASLLRHAIHSVLAQTYRHLELLVVDDASTDSTPQVVDAIRDSRLRHIRLVENRRAAHARNVAMREARGSLFAFNDDDDLWLAEKLAKQVAHLRASPPDVGISICGHLQQWPKGCYYVGGERYFDQLDFTGGMLDHLDMSLGVTPGWLVRREVVERVGGFDERMRCCDDWELAARMSRVCRFAHLDEPLFLQERRRAPGAGMWDNLPNFLNDYCVIIEKQSMDWSPRIRSKNLHQVARAAQAVGDVASARPWLEKAVRAHPFNLEAWADLIRARRGRAIDRGRWAGVRPPSEVERVDLAASFSEPPLVSVILPTYNCAGSLPRALISVLGQSWQNLEVIVVDDGSTDGTADVIARWRDSRLRSIRNEVRTGKARATNVGLRAARGEFIAFQECDDEWIAGRLEQQMAVFAASRPEIALVGGVLERYYRGEHRFVEHRWQSGASMTTVSAIYRDRFIHRFQAFLQTAVIRRSTLERAGTFDESLEEMHDFELCLRLLEHGEFRSLSSVVSLRHDERDTFASGIAGRSRAMRAIVEKHAKLYRDAGDVMFTDWYRIAHQRLKAGDAIASARAAREAARCKPADYRPWILWALMTAAQPLGHSAVRAVRRARALLHI